MARYRSPYSQRQSSRNVVPIIILSLFAVGVIAFGLFLLADRFGSSAVGPDDPSGSEQVAEEEPTEEAAGEPSPEPPDPEDLETARDVADGWVQLWEDADYRGMYELLSADAQTRITRDEFVERYEGIARELGQTSIDVEITDSIEEAMRFTLSVHRESSRIGSFDDEVTLPLFEDESGSPRVDWTPSVIINELGDGFVRWRPDIPQRGRILDRDGRPLAHLGEINQVGIVPGQIEDEDKMLSELSGLLEMSEESIRARYSGGQPEWFMPIKDYPADMDQELLSKLSEFPAVSVRTATERVYPAGRATAHIVGYLTEINEEELAELASEGYMPGDKIGRAGIEAWGEDHLNGTRGGRMVIVGPNNNERKIIAERQSEPAADIRLTIDLELQQAALAALGDRTGSIVIINPSNGAILAMASNPTFDPNRFILGHTEQSWSEINDPERRPLENRATTFTYPTGSLFKVVPMAAAMEHLDMTPNTTIECPGQFSIGDTDQVWRDWMPGGQGTLTLHNALVQSCNTVFYQIGEQLDQQDPNLLPDAARGFGFGSPTGLESLHEAAGTVPDPEWKVSTIGDFWARGDAINLSIGQGFFEATPLQVAAAYAGVANGGTLYKPYVVQEVVSIEGEVIQEAQPEEKGKIPFSDEEILSEIRDAMRDVTQASNGTAADAFSGVSMPSAGKTGTAESGQEQPHSWFAGFMPGDSPEMTIISMAEYAGEGSRVAAPMAREVVDAWIELRE